ncbi:CAP domain-containing protein [Kovacikia minuta CCNUW1]|uniref:CAP domain-containing protein n=1 Tax=Kovacikia minuta TaxID=2931930 RepID=UPI001CCF1390|nr:CAP domain-containing protein [Kovacikia minuta]UBF27800.1 CAP domain-containing protein [Kovacikia minuta CCNUW1]
MTPTLLKIALISAFTTTLACVPNATAQFPVAIPFQLNQASSQRTYQMTASLQTTEQAVHNQINQYRVSRGLPPLTLDSQINAQARAHSQAMASGRVPFSHNGFQQRVKTIARTIPYAGAAENVSYSKGYQDPATQAVKGWLKSPGHLKNIVGKYGLTGIGVAQNSKGEVYITQIFIRRKG